MVAAQNKAIIYGYVLAHVARQNIFPHGLLLEERQQVAVVSGRNQSQKQIPNMECIRLVFIIYGNP